MEIFDSFQSSSHEKCFSAIPEDGSFLERELRRVFQVIIAGHRLAAARASLSVLPLFSRPTTTPSLRRRLLCLLCSLHGLARFLITSIDRFRILTQFFIAFVQFCSVFGVQCLFDSR